MKNENEREREREREDRIHHLCVLCDAIIDNGNNDWFKFSDEYFICMTNEKEFNPTILPRWLRDVNLTPVKGYW